MPFHLERIIYCGHRDILQGKVSQGKFANWIHDHRGVGFFPIGTINIKFEEEKILGL